MEKKRRNKKDEKMVNMHNNQPIEFIYFEANQAFKSRSRFEIIASN